MMQISSLTFTNEVDTRLFDKLMAFVSFDKRERIKRFRYYDDGVRSLLGDVLARILICRTLNKRNKDLVFGRKEYGKPFIKNADPLDFNISHSWNKVVVVIDDGPVGISVERIMPVDFNIAGSLFSMDEYAGILSKKGNERTRYFFELWTMKESYVKSTGRGLSIPLDSFSIDIKGFDVGFKSRINGDAVYFKGYSIGKDYVSSVSSFHNGFPADIEVMEIEELEKAICSFG